MDDIEQIVGGGFDPDLPPMVDEVVNIYLMSGDTVPLKQFDAGELFNKLRRVGHVSVRDGKGTVIHLFAHGVAGIAGFSKQTVDETREAVEEWKRRLRGDS